MVIELLISAICQIESTNNHKAINVSDYGAASYGYCQVKLNTARLVGYKGGPTTLWLNKATNKATAKKYLVKQLKRYGCIEYAVAAYNAGKVKKRNGKLINQQYVERVLDIWKSKLTTTDSLKLLGTCGKDTPHQRKILSSL